MLIASHSTIMLDLCMIDDECLCRGGEGIYAGLVSVK